MNRVLVAVFLTLFLLSSSGRVIAETSIIGEYTKQEVHDVTLRITGDTMQVTSGPMALTFKYAIRSTGGNKTTAELDDGAGHKREVTLTLEGDILTISGHGAVNGHWKRK